MPDDDRTRRRLGDETKGRIADLASGWTVGEEATPEPPPPSPATPPPRKKQKTVPPPPPGSEARKALEQAIVETKGPPRTKPPTAPPPARGKPTSPPPLARSKQPSPAPPIATGAPAKARTADASGPADRPAVAGRQSGSIARPLSSVKSGPTETGTVDVSGVIGGDATPAPLLVKDLPAGSAVGTPPPQASPQSPGSREVREAPAGKAPAGKAGSPPARSVPPPKTGARIGPAPAPLVTPRAGAASGATAAPAAAMKPGAASGATAVPAAAMKPGAASGATALPAAATKLGSASGATAIPVASPAPGSASGGATLPVRAKADSVSGGTAVPARSNADSVSGGTAMPARSKAESAPGGTPVAARSKAGSASGPATAIPSAAPRSSSGKTMPPPIPKAGSASGSVAAIAAPPPTPLALPLRADTTDVSAPPSAVPPPLPPQRLPRAPVVVDHDDSMTEVDPGAHLAVPVGEFDHGQTRLEQDKLRVAYQQATIKRDAASALLGIAEAPLTVVKATPAEVLLTENAEHGRGDPTSLDQSTSRFERGDPTIGADAMPMAMPTTTPAAKLRSLAALRRKRGIFGDVKYVATALLGVRHARRELAMLETQQTARQQSRRRHLTTLGRTAVITEGFDHPALGRAREQLAGVEDERSQHAGQVAAADQELQRVRRDREAKEQQHAADVAAIEAELVDIAKKLEPLEKEVAAAGRRAGELREALQRIDAKIAQVEASKVTVKGPKLDPAAIKAELVTLRADRLAVQRDEPVIASELDSLNPRIAALEARRVELRKRRTELELEETNDQRRIEELLTAIGAKRRVVDRAAGDAEALRDKILFELGERIYVDRPDDMFAQLAPIESIDMELGTTDRRIMELKEILGSVDRAKLARGLAVTILVLALVGLLIGWTLYLAL